MEKDLHTYQKMAREIFDSLVKAVGIHVMLLVIEKAFWNTKHKYEEASLISFSEDGINLDRLEKLEPEKAALVAHDFVMAIIDTLGRLIGKKMAEQLIEQLNNQGGE
ncbi:MAG: hypothetical protein WCY82_11625 [Desulfotomaculaceae bacterium]